MPSRYPAAASHRGEDLKMSLYICKLLFATALLMSGKADCGVEVQQKSQCRATCLPGSLEGTGIGKMLRYRLASLCFVFLLCNEGLRPLLLK